MSKIRSVSKSARNIAIPAIAVGYFALLLITLRIFLSPSVDTILITFTGLLAIVSVLLVFSSRIVFETRSEFTAKGLVGEGNRIHLIEYLVSKSLEEKPVDFDDARITISQDGLRIGFYKDDRRVVRMRIDNDTGLFKLEIKQPNEKVARTVASRIISLLRDGAHSAGMNFKVASGEPTISDQEQTLLP